MKAIFSVSLLDAGSRNSLATIEAIFKFPWGPWPQLSALPVSNKSKHVNPSDIFTGVLIASNVNQIKVG